MDSGEWMNDPGLKSIDREKLQMLQQLASQGSQKSQSDLVPFLMAAASSGRKKGMQFSSDEMNAIIEALKMGKSQQEQAKMDKIIQMMKMMRR